ncbi:hypothetical protein [Microbacterium flavescens]|uniref:hypothetical protein n=1 Tax=Microbacterium flavescens TaxID=69366 RepID=UPI001BDDE75F|nr:hypothetical protein [Microbacterium flavescens]
METTITGKDGTVLTTLGIVVFFSVAATIVGLPVALRLRRDGEGWARVAADALPLGIVLATLTGTAGVWLGWPAVVVCMIGWVSLVVLAVLRLRHGDAPVRPTRPRRIWFAILVVVTAVGAVVLRLHEVEFVPWVGDMGAYVNWANEFVRSGLFTANWPPLFPLLLTGSAAVFGTAHTTAIVAVCGFALLTSVAVLLSRLGVPSGFVLAAVAVLAIHPHVIWYATFPSSEALNAPLFVVWAGLVHATLAVPRRILPATLGAQLLVITALSLLRGSGVFFIVPIVTLLVATLAVPDWRAARRRTAATAAVTVLGAGVGYWYGIAKIPGYFVDMQVANLVPGPLVNMLQTFGLLDMGPAAVAAILLPVILLSTVAWRLPDTRAVRLTRAPASLGISAGIVILLATVACLAAGALTGGILVRIGLGFVIAAAVTFALLPRARRGASFDLLLMLFAVSIVMFLALHTVRLGPDRGHSFYIYWDRYLVSEVLPALIIVSALGAAALWPLLRSRALKATSAAVAGAAIVGMSAGPVALQSSGTEMAGAYDFTGRLAAWAEPGDTAMWSSTDGAGVVGWGFPNTWMSFAVPLRRTFGIDVINGGQGRPNFSNDEVLDEELVSDYLACRPGVNEVLVYELSGTGPTIGQRLDEPGWSTEKLGFERGVVTVLHQPASQGWLPIGFDVTVWRVTAPVDASETDECPTTAPPPAAVPADPTWAFHAGSAAVGMLGDGWSEPESWGTWSDGGEASVHLALPESWSGAARLAANLEAYVPTGGNAQRVQVHAGNNLLGEWMVGSATTLNLQIPTTAIARGGIDLTFSMPDAVSPADSGESADERMLGVGLRSITLSAP